MNAKRAAYLIVLISLLFATAILASSYFLADSSHAQTVTYIWIALWWILFSFLLSVQQGGRARNEFDCIRRSLSKWFARRG